MINVSIDKYSKVKIGDNIIIQVSEFDRGKRDFHNIIGVILEENEHNFYKIGTDLGILSNYYSRNEV